MGIACGFIRLRDRTIEALVREPRLIYPFRDFDEPGPPVDGFFARLFGKRGPAPPPPPGELLDAREDGDEGDVDKAWHGIHYVLTGTADATDHPLGFLVSGGTPIGSEDFGYGPDRAFSSAQLAAITGLLESLDRVTLFARYEPKKMDRAGVYPQFWARDGDDGFDYIFENFERMRAFFIEAQKHQFGLLIFLC